MRSRAALLALCLAGCGGAVDEGDEAVADAVTGSRVDGAHPEVGLFFPYDPDFPLRGCSALLVAPRVALTSAHCLEGPGGYFVEVPKSLLRFDGQPQPISRGYVHPGYGAARTLEHDLAVLVLARPSAVRPAVVGVDPRRGERVTIVGYGSTSANRANDQNRDLANPQRRTGVNTIDAVARYSIDLGGASGGESATCEGDSGGPAFVDRGRGPLAVAITSRGTCDAAFSWFGWSDDNVSSLTRIDTNLGFVDGVRRAEGL